ncbi:MAG: DUF4105 domain-containing protein [Bacteriovoracaceae bacterium]
MKVRILGPLAQMLFNFFKFTLAPILLGGLFVNSALAQSAHDTQWLRLLHYKQNLFGQYVSEADGGHFFLSSQGKKSPEKELEAFKESLNHLENNQNSVVCRFPARIRWYKKYHSELSIDDSFCTELNAFRSRLEGKSISIVFSSYFLNNPASSFGHTFIRIGKSEQKSSTELLDTGVNFGANVGNANPVVYAVGGFTGFFPGTFTAIPYYYKVREYNDYETRDLWSYHLDFTQEQIDLVVDHIWELGHTYFDYYFLTENCSYHVLTILEAARPDVHLTDKLPYLYTIPSDTLKILHEEKLIKNISMRPAPSTVFKKQLISLNETEKEQVKQLVYHGKDLVEGSAEKKALIYDSALSLVDYQFAKEILKQEEEGQKIKRPILLARSQVPVRSPELDFSSSLRSAPHLGHGSKRFGIGFSQYQGKNSLDAEWRFAFHDFLDHSTGFLPLTTLEVLRFQVRSDGQKYKLRELDLVNVMTLSPINTFNKSPSWRFTAGEWQTFRNKKMLATEGIKAGVGASLQFDFVAPYLMAAAESSYVSSELHQGKFSSGADFGAILNLNQYFKMHSVFEWRARPWNESRWLNEVRYSDSLNGVSFYFQNYWVNGFSETGIRFFKYL